jgi:multiple sugar transport system permease protein
LRIRGELVAGYRKTAIGFLLVGVYLFPIYWMVATSLKRPADIMRRPPALLPVPLDTGSYKNAIVHNVTVLRALENSLIISVGAVVLTLLLAVPAAYAVARLKMRFAGVVVLLLLVTQLLPSIVLAGPLFALFRQADLINTYSSLILADTTITLPFAVIVLRPLLLGIPRELEEAGQIDGCSRIGVMWWIVLPVLRPSLIAVAAFSFLFAWGEFVYGLALTSGEAIEPVTVALNRFVGLYGTRWTEVMAVATALTVPVVAMFAFFQRHIVRGIIEGSVKG